MIGKLFGTFLLIFFGLAAFSLTMRVVSLPFQAANNAVSVAQQIISPENALQQYRYFHDAAASLDAFPGKLSAAKANVKYAEEHNPDYAPSRMTEFTGALQVCQQLVQDYNQRAQRLDAGFFRNPERWLPVAAAPWQPLPQQYATNFCEGVNQ